MFLLAGEILQLQSGSIHQHVSPQKSQCMNIKWQHNEMIKIIQLSGQKREIFSKMVGQRRDYKPAMTNATYVHKNHCYKWDSIRCGSTANGHMLLFSCKVNDRPTFSCVADDKVNASTETVNALDVNAVILWQHQRTEVIQTRNAASLETLTTPATIYISLYLSRFFWYLLSKK